MRNLKKILALVLALMMVVSMMVTASATSFVDDADINDKYYEAVSVLSGIGVIRGVENADGSYSFQPKGNLNRAQAATIIAYVLLGNLDGIEDEVSVYENPFTDVAEWAVPYVLFAHSRGIIVGRNETTYDPNATITGYELGKMLLISALGYDNADFVNTVWVVDGKAYADEAEAFVASLNAGGAAITTKTIAKSDWQVTVAKGLKDAGIWNSEFVLSKKLTREEACYLAFNTVIASTLDTDVFGLQVGADVDEFGRTTKVYTSTKEALKNMTIALDNYKAPTVFVATAAKTADAAGVNALLGLKDKAALADGEGLEVYLNGAKGDHSINIGDTVEVYAADGKISKIVIVREALATVSVAAKAETEGDYKGLYKYTFSTGAITYAAKDAYNTKASYLVINDGEELLNVANPTVISNAKITKADAATPAGATYVYVNDQKLVKATVSTVLDGAAFNKAYDYILNSNGYLVAITAVAEVEVDAPKLETGIAYLVSAEKQITTTANGASLIGGAASYAWDVVAVAQLAMPDGTFGIVELKVETTKNKDTGIVEGLKINGVAMGDVENDAAPEKILSDIYGWVNYTIQEDGTYTLAAVTGTQTVNLKQNTSIIGTNLYATSSTVWTHYEVNPKTYAVTTTVEVGLGSYEKNGKDYTALVTTNKNNTKVVTEIVTFGEYVAPTVENKVYEAYFNGAGEYVLGVQSNGFFHDGEYAEYFYAETLQDGSVTPEKGGIYTLTLDADGNIVKVAADKTTATGVVEYTDDTLTIIDGTTYINYYFECYNISTGHTGEVDTLEVGDTVTFAHETYKGTLEILVAYITKEAE